MHDRIIQRNNIPRWMNRPKGITHKAVQNWFVRSSDKDGQSLLSTCLQIRTSNPRGYNTGNVPQSYGPEDGNLYGDASSREAEDESATVSKNMRLVPQNEAPAHGFSGGRAAQGTMSRSPDAAAQSGKVYDQETASGKHKRTVCNTATRKPGRGPQTGKVLNNGEMKMEINGKVHCFFEQSGTFKNEFIKLGIPAEDYDIQDNFGQTDHVVDLFSEIEKAYGVDQSVFDNITKDDLIVAFFPCIYFSCISSVWFSLTQRDYKTWPVQKIIDNIIDRNKKRSTFFELLNKLCAIALKKGFRLIIENPWSENHFLKFGFLKPPTLVDKNRTARGDFFVKPTAYWFWNCEPTSGQSFQQPKMKKNILYSRQAKETGICSEERSMISPDYARNFICDFILGKKQDIGQLSLF